MFFSFNTTVGSFTIILLVAGFGYTFVLLASSSNEVDSISIIRAALVVISVLLHFDEEELASEPTDVLWSESKVLKVHVSLAPSNGTSNLVMPGLNTTGCADASNDPPFILFSVPIATYTV